MNREIAGKMTSAVSGRDENTDAVAKELNATSTLNIQLVSSEQPVETGTHKGCLPKVLY